MKRRIRFLLFGRKAWAEREALINKSLKEFRKAGLKVQIRKVVTKDDVKRAVRAVVRTRETWCNFCYGNSDIKVAEPLNKALFPEPTEEEKKEPSGSPLDFSPLPFAFNAYMVRAVRVRRAERTPMVGAILVPESEE